ncbi:helix-turn-helix domain-containing protein [Clostridioides mangenotii]|uniref:helix-turn-helix domain-containing protein n=1 Tax=Metaclostridioides mangenotii TaxID=1540 RepID=UPI001C112433|nr:helix-turn-helix domain-containing protein [Clostridioides mangenotii]MBU5308421.1 helix-turn-helix domain-containing protein [Clostridioides mangenotii]
MNLLKDNREKNWFMVENELIDNLQLTTYEKMIYIVLVRHTNEDSNCFPSMSTISKKAGCSVATVKRTVKSLEDKSLIKKVTRKVEGKKENNSNLYYIMSAKGGVCENLGSERHNGRVCENPQVGSVRASNNTNINNTNITSMYIENEDEPVDNSLGEFSKLYQQNIGVVNGITAQWLVELSKEMELDLFRRAVEICTERGKLTQGYLKGIIKQWNDNNITTYEQLKALELEREQGKIKSKERKTTSKETNYRSKKTGFHNFEESFTQYSSDELDEIIRKSQREKFK